MTREEFIQNYCETSGVTWEWLQQHRSAIPCTCGEKICQGWAMVPRFQTPEKDAWDDILHEITEKYSEFMS